MQRVKLQQRLFLELKSLQDKGVKLVIELQSAAQFRSHLLVRVRVRIRQCNILGVEMVKDVGEPARHEGLHHREGDVPLFDDTHHAVLQLQV